MDEKEHGRRGGIVGPVVLIGLGIVFLLHNLGVVGWSIWEVLLRLWPILLVAAGLDLMLGRRSIWGGLLALALTAALLVGALLLSGAGIERGRAGQGEEVTHPLEDVDLAEVAIDPGVGTLRVRGGTDSQNLVEGEAALSRGESLAESYVAQDGKAAFALRTESSSFGPFQTGWTGQRVWDLRLTTRVPLGLETDLGLGVTDLDLTDLTLESLNVKQGIGQATIVLPEEGRLTARIEGAIGQTVVVIPEGLAARIRLDTGIAGRQIAEDYVCEDDVCTSAGYGGAEDRVDLELSQAIGSVVVRH